MSMKTNKKIVLNIWDILHYKIWDKICEIKGLGDDFTFGSIYEKDIAFELNEEEARKLGVQFV